MEKVTTGDIIVSLVDQSTLLVRKCPIRKGYISKSLSSGTSGVWFPETTVNHGNYPLKNFRLATDAEKKLYEQKGPHVLEAEVNTGVVFEDLTSRYLKALVDNAQCISCNKGDYFKILANPGENKLKIQGTNKTIWEANHSEFGKSWELMPAGFDPLELTEAVAPPPFIYTQKSATALIEEARQRGFAPGVTFIDLVNKLPFVVKDFDIYDSGNYKDELYINVEPNPSKPNKSARIYSRGQWAEIVQEELYKVGDWVYVETSSRHNSVHRWYKNANCVEKDKVYQVTDVDTNIQFNAYTVRINDTAVRTSAIRKALPHEIPILQDMKEPGPGDYVELIQDSSWGLKKGAVCKIIEENVLSSNQWILENIYIPNNQAGIGITKHQFFCVKRSCIPSTKEAYERQGPEPSLQELEGFRVGDVVKVVMSGYGVGCDKKYKSTVITELSKDGYYGKPAARTIDFKNRIYDDWISLESFEVVKAYKEWSKSSYPTFTGSITGSADNVIAMDVSTNQVIIKSNSEVLSHQEPIIIKSKSKKNKLMVV